MTERGWKYKNAGRRPLQRPQALAGHLFRLYDAPAPPVWNSYAAAFIFAAAIGPPLAGGNSTHFEAVMKDHSQGDNADPYSPLMCILLLLMVVAATQFKLLAVWF